VLNKEVNFVMDDIYIQFKKDIFLSEQSTVRLMDVINISAPTRIKRKIEPLVAYQVEEHRQREIIVDGLYIIRVIHENLPDTNIRLIGETYTVIYLEKSNRKYGKIFVPIIWLLLFIGTAMTIMNFHHDVGMQEVQQKIHFIITGKKNDYPLLLQIPYSIGLGIGMILFFNYWFTKRFNREPSPLEVELFKYDQDLEQYKHHETVKRND